MSNIFNRGSRIKLPTSSGYRVTKCELAWFFSEDIRFIGIVVRENIFGWKAIIHTPAGISPRSLSREVWNIEII